MNKFLGLLVYPLLRKDSKRKLVRVMMQEPDFTGFYRRFSTLEAQDQERLSLLVDYLLADPESARRALYPLAEEEKNEE